MPPEQIITAGHPLLPPSHSLDVSREETTAPFITSKNMLLKLQQNIAIKGMIKFDLSAINDPKKMKTLERVFKLAILSMDIDQLLTAIMVYSVITIKPESGWFCADSNKQIMTVTTGKNKIDKKVSNNEILSDCTKDNKITVLVKLENGQLILKLLNNKSTRKFSVKVIGDLIELCYGTSLSIAVSELDLKEKVSYTGELGKLERGGLVPNGYGLLSFADGSCHWVGVWNKGVLSKGEILYADGRIYCGDLRHFEPNGRGKMRCDSTFTIEGLWVDGKFNSQHKGVLRYNEQIYSWSLRNKKLPISIANSIEWRLNQNPLANIDGAPVIREDGAIEVGGLIVGTDGKIYRLAPICEEGIDTRVLATRE